MTSLQDSTSVATGAAFGFIEYGFNAYNGAGTSDPWYGAAGTGNASLTNDQQLFNGTYNQGGNQTGQFTLTNIPYAQYSVYVIGDATSLDSASGLGSVQLFIGGTGPTATAGPTYWFHNGDTSDITIPASVSWVQAVGTTQGTATTGATYALFSGLTASTVSFDTFAPGISYNDGLHIGAIEIVDDVPEPSTYAMMLGGLGMLLGMQKFRRRRS